MRASSSARTRSSSASSSDIHFSVRSHRLCSRETALVESRVDRCRCRGQPPRQAKTRVISSAFPNVQERLLRIFCPLFVSHFASSFGGSGDGDDCWLSGGSIRLHGLFAISVLSSRNFSHSASVSSQSRVSCPRSKHHLPISMGGRVALARGRWRTPGLWATWAVFSGHT